MAAGSGGWILSDGVPEREKNSAAFFYRLLEHAPPSRLGESDKLEQHRLSLSLSLSLSIYLYLSHTHIIPDALALATLLQGSERDAQTGAYCYSEL